MTNLILLTLLFSISSCARLNSNGKKVKLSHNTNDAKDCTFVKLVYAFPPYHTRDDWKIKIRNSAGEVGADLVVTDSSPWAPKVEGKAYTCQN